MQDISKPWQSNFHSCYHQKSSKRHLKTLAFDLLQPTKHSKRTVHLKARGPFEAPPSTLRGLRGPFHLPGPSKHPPRMVRGSFENRSRTVRRPFQTLQEPFENRSRTVREPFEDPSRTLQNSTKHPPKTFPDPSRTV